MTAREEIVSEDAAKVDNAQRPQTRRSVEHNVIRKQGDRLYVRSEAMNSIGGKQLGAKPSLSQEIAGLDENFHVYETPGRPGQVSVETAKKHPAEAVLRNKYLGPPFGFVPGSGGHSIAELLRGSTSLRIADAQSELDGVPVDTLKAGTAYGVITLSVGRPDGVMRRVSVEKRSGDLLDERVIDRPNALQEDEMRSWTAVFDSETVEQVAGRPLVSAGKLTIAITRKKHSTEPYVYVARYTFTDIELRPDLSAPAAFRPTLADGTPVRNLDDKSGVSYEWRDGRVSKRVDAQVVSQVSDLVARRPSPSARHGEPFWSDWKVIIAGCLIVIAVCAVLVANRSRSNRIGKGAR